MAKSSLLLTVLFASLVSADDYARGYAQGVVDALSPDKSIEIAGVAEGKAVVEADGCVAHAQRETLGKALIDTAAITSVQWRAERCALASASSNGASDTGAGDIVLLPEGALFAPLLADPREPRYAGHYQAQEIPGGSFNGGVAAVGDYFPLVRGNTGVGQLELGVQAGIFSLFNFDTESFNLINTDFIVGFPVSYRSGSFSARADVYHQSSHLGDEFLLGMPDVERVNFSFEDAELLLAYEWRGARLYGGGGYFVRTEPDLDPSHVQGGLEYRWRGLIDDLDLVAASDFQAFEEQDWDVSRAFQLGVAWRGGSGREVRLMAQRYDGFSPNGQFFDVPIEFWGLALVFDP